MPKEDAFAERLDSWKEIAAYLKRGVTTVQRWEQREGLPVCRHLHDRRGSVYAFKSEIDAWWLSRGPRLGVEEPRTRWRRSLRLEVEVGLFVLAAVTVGALAVAWLRTTASINDTPPKIQLAVNDELQVGPGSAVAVSPDGRHVVYVAWRNGIDRLFRRSTSELEGPEIPYTERARSPFFSPDGKWVGFFADGTLKKLPMDGGPAVTICTVAGQAAGASWGTDDTIVFGQFGSGLQRIAAAGGTPESVTRLTGEPGVVDHRWPEWLPDSRIVFFTIWSGSLNTARVAAQSLDTNDRRILDIGSNPQVFGRSVIAFVRPDGIWAAPFDANHMSLGGAAARVVDTIRPRHGGAADYDLARDGSLAYVATSRASRNALVWVDLEGRITRIADDGQLYSSPRVSPDGTRIAVVARSPTGVFGIWVHDLVRATKSRLPTDVASFDPVWTPDGKRIVFAAIASGPSNLYSIAADGSGRAEPVLKGPLAYYPSSWSPDGTMLAYQEMTMTSRNDIWVVSSGGNRHRLFGSAFDETDPRFSPDGRWLAYTSNESGRHQLYVEPHPQNGKRWLVSPGDAREPVWSPRGDAIYYRNWGGNQLFRVALTGAPTFSSGKPALLFEGPYEGRTLAGASANYDIAPDGAKFVMIRREGDSTPRQIVIDFEWFKQVERR